MVSARRLLIISCSRRKRCDPDALPAIERYDGPAFHVLRRFLRKRPEAGQQLDVFIFSAMYGLISAQHPVAFYDQIMTPERAKELHCRVMASFAEIIRVGYSEFCLALGSRYLTGFEGWLDFLPDRIPVTRIDGPQGVRLAQLKAWLWDDKPESIEPKRQSIGHRGIVALRRVTLELTPSQVLERAQEALAVNAVGADRFRYWVVPVDDRHVSPKWLVSKLTGLPVSTFTSKEARRVLNQLGVQTQRVLGGQGHEV